MYDQLAIQHETRLANPIQAFHTPSRFWNALLRNDSRTLPMSPTCFHSAACSGCYHSKAARPSTWSCRLGRSKPWKACHQRQCDLLLRRLRHIRRMLTAESEATLVHAFVTSRVDYCDIVLDGAPTNCNVCVMNAVAGVLSSDRYREVWPWFDAADAWQSPLAWRAWACQVQCHHLDSSLPHRYRATVSSCRLCSGLRDGTETSSTLRRWSSALVPLYRLNSCGLWVFSVLGPRLWNSLPDCCVTLATTLLAFDILWRHFSLSD